MWFFVPPFEFLAYISDPSEHKILLAFWLGIAAWLVYDVVILKENFCVYVCPYARCSQLCLIATRYKSSTTKIEAAPYMRARRNLKSQKTWAGFCKFSFSQSPSKKQTVIKLSPQKRYQASKK